MYEVCYFGHEAKINMDIVAESYDYPAESYDYPAQNTYIHFDWDDLYTDVDHHVWEKVLKAGLPQDVDEFYLLVWW